MNLTNITDSVKNLEEEALVLKGKISMLEETYVKTTKKLDTLKENQIINIKALELLNLIQKSTKDLIEEMFNNVVTKALQYIHQDDKYEFELEFSKRGNIPKMSFLLKTPDMQESHNIMTTRAGGSKDIIALALRFILLEVSKNKGFLFLDEPFKRLDNEETIKKAVEFIKETQRNTDRQIIIITHKDEVIDNISNPIIIKNEEQSNAKTK